MFRNDKKGRFYGINKDTTFVENPPLEDNTTKVTRSINFSKSNFVSLGKWILIIVLFLYFGSYTINGFVASNITKNSTEETIVHEYKKQIGTEIVCGNFDDFTFDNFGELTFNKKIFFKKQVPVVDFVTINSGSYGAGGHFGLSFVAGGFKLFDNNDNLLYNSNYDTNFRIIFKYYLSSYSNQFDYLVFYIYNQDGLDVPVYYCDIIGNYSSNYNYVIKYPTASYFTYTRYYDTNSYIKNYSSYDSRVIMNDGYFNRILNETLIYDYMEELPIYETTTYTYDIKDINYNWDYKLMQISKFRPLFNSEDLFVNEDFYKYSNLITYEFKNTDIEKENVVNKYKSDERLKILFDNESITIKGREYNFHLIKAKKDYISYINFDYSKIDMLDEDVYNAYIYALENYVNNNNIDDYFIYSKMNFDAKDLLILMSFPLQLVVNTLYNFGVLVGIIVLW